MRIPLPKVNG